MGAAKALNIKDVVVLGDASAAKEVWKTGLHVLGLAGSVAADLGLLCVPSRAGGNVPSLCLMIMFPGRFPVALGYAVSL